MLLNQFCNLMLTGGTNTAPSIDWSTIITSSSFDGLLSGITTVLPVVVPVALVIAGIPIVWKLIKRMMRG